MPLYGIPGFGNTKCLIRLQLVLFLGNWHEIVPSLSYVQYYIVISIRKLDKNALKDWCLIM